jgi:hypothetical protein
MRKYGGHMGKFDQNNTQRTYGNLRRTYGNLKKYEKILKNSIADIWEKMADM